MAGSPRKLTVVVSASALASLDEIWLWNATKNGRDHADAYLAFLDAETSNLGTDYRRGRPVISAPGVQYIVIRRSRRGHGHIAVYEIVGDEIHIIDYFHTAQDWEKRLRSDPS